MINAFPKIFTIGQDYIKDIFDGDVEITEKVDGSQFNFGMVNGKLYMRSKGAQLFPELPEKLFEEAINYVCFIKDSLPDGLVFHAEYLKKPKHNVLAYSRIPKNHLALFGISHFGKHLFVSDYLELQYWANQLGIEPVPLLHHGEVRSLDFLKILLDTDSFLGNQKIEGIVVKNYHKAFLLGGQPIPVMMGKYVSERFKERHIKEWDKQKPQNKLQTFIESYCTEARWQKAVQHLAEKGGLTNSPKDIGELIKEVQRDLEEEEKETIKSFLWKEYKPMFLRKAVAGLPEWYKQKLMEGGFENV